MRILNVVIIVVLIAMVWYHFRVVSEDSKEVAKYENIIENKKSTIDSLYIVNDSIDYSIIVLNNTIDSFRIMVDAYDDSINEITNRYEYTVKEVMGLNDSLSVVRFRLYTSRNAERFGVNINR